MLSPRLRLAAIIGLTLAALYAAAPTVVYFALPKKDRNNPEILAKSLPSWLPQKHIRLGLDLQGGVQLVLSVDTQVAIDNKMSRIGTEMTRWAKDNNHKVATAYVLKGKQTLRVELEPDAKADDFRLAFKKDFPGLTLASTEGTKLDFKYDEGQLTRIRDAALEQAERVVRGRVDRWGVSEPQITRRADKSILIQLPGFKDPEKAKELLGRTAQLKFKLVDEEFKGFEALTKSLPEGVTYERGGNNGAITFVSENHDAIVDMTKALIPEGRELLFETETLANGKKTRYKSILLKSATEISGEDVMDAGVTTDSNSFDQRPAVSLKFSSIGGKRFSDLTGENVKKRMAIVLDDVIVSAPVINQRIPGGSAIITLGGDKGYNETITEANELSLILKSGALPAPIKVLEQREVGATLGPELANQGVIAVLVGLVAVFGYMVVYYGFPGVISCIALGLNALFLLVLMASFGFALTLPGFAGFILTLGMAVDANVLINERIRQELKEGKTPKKAVEFGFDRVFWTVFDSNITTLIAAVVLLEANASGPIKGFAVSLVLGLLVSMFTALYCSKVMFQWAVNGGVADSKVRNWLGGKAADASKVFNFKFLKYGPAAMGLGLVIVLGIFGVLATKGMNWSVDFAGGTEMEVAFGKSLKPSELRDALDEAGVKDPTLQAVGEGDKRYLIRFENGKAEEDSAGTQNLLSTIKQTLQKKLGDFQPDVLRTDFVGPLIGKELRKQGVQSVFFAMFGIFLYIILRFDMRFAPGAMIKMTFDAAMLMAYYTFFQRSFDLTAVAAILTVIGYSVNDTIVIYDRIRENLQAHPGRDLAANVTVSLNETLIRSLNTSLVTVLSLLGILFSGSSSIWDFAMGMLVGVVSATFSSTFVSSSGVVWTENFRKAWDEKQRAKQPKPAPPAAGRSSR